MIALYITNNGKKVCDRLKSTYKDRVVIKKIESNALNEAFKEAFTYKKIIAIMATGIVVRAIAPYIKDKTKDPAIVVIDEKGKYVISLLSGHLGGANELAKDIAKMLGATPVITTSSDVQGYKALDLYAKEKGYIIKDMKLYKKIAILMAQNKKDIPVFLEESEEKAYFSSPFFKTYKNINSFLKRKGYKIAVSWQTLPCQDILYLIPKKLVLGIGLHRGISFIEVYKFIEKIFKEKGIHMEAISRIATIDKRKEEICLKELSKTLSANLVFYSADDLQRVSGIKTNEVVAKYHGTGNVCEASAILGSNYGKIILPKIKGEKITICIARENSIS